MPDEARIESRSDRWDTHYVVTGTKAQVEAAVARILADRPPQGYGTTFKPPVEITPSVWQATGNRSNSCD